MQCVCQRITSYTGRPPDCSVWECYSNNNEISPTDASLWGPPAACWGRRSGAWAPQRHLPHPAWPWQWPGFAEPSPATPTHLRGQAPDMSWGSKKSQTPAIRWSMTHTHKEENRKQRWGAGGGGIEERKLLVKKNRKHRWSGGQKKLKKGSCESKRTENKYGGKKK